MKRNDYVLSVVFGAVYVALIPFITGLTITWGDPEPWYNAWGRSNFVAVSWLQTYHSIGLILAAIPVSLLILIRFRSAWLRPSLIAALVGCAYMLFDQIRGAWIIWQHDLEMETIHLGSGVIDVVKVGPTLLIVVALLQLVFRSRKIPT